MTIYTKPFTRSAQMVDRLATSIRIKAICLTLDASNCVEGLDLRLVDAYPPIQISHLQRENK
jgi:hypothetical protein